jgi:translation initiation factor 3 subunit D
MKLGYVSRVHPKDSYNHVLLTVQGYKPKEFAAQINLSVNNMWGILKVHAATHFLISIS